MKTLFILLLVSSPCLLWANTAVKFEKDNSAGSVMIQGFQDHDADDFYASLTLPEQNNGKVKQKEFLSADQGFQILCKYPIIAPSPLCVVRVLQSPHSLIDSQGKRLEYKVQGPEAAAIAAVFKPNSGNGFQYLTNDKKLQIFAVPEHVLVQFKD